MLNQYRRFKLIAAFANARRSDYLELASAEWSQLSGSLVKALVGAGLAVLGSLFFLTFLSIAAIVTAWESDWRILTAWLVALVWLSVCAAGGLVVYSASRRLHPFRQTRDELSKDLAVVRGAR